MGFFGLLFWVAIFWLAYRAMRSWGYCGGRSRGRGQGETAEVVGNRREDQQAYIDALESRVSDLEERLDFTERLLASRNAS